METSRRLSLTLLFVAPLLAAREIPLSSESEEAADTSVFYKSGENLSYQPLDVEYTDTWATDNDDLGERRKRSLETPGEDMETAEQILFRPMFRHRQIVVERAEKARQRGELKTRPLGQETILSVAAAPAPPGLSPASQGAAKKKGGYFATPLGAVYRFQRSLNSDSRHP